MAENETPAIEALEQADDFKRINGIKKGMEARLHASGVTSYAQLGALTSDEILAKLGRAIGYTTRRIVEEDWAGQARALAEQAQLAEEKARLEAGMFRQHTATFTVEVLLGAENDVRRTRMLHIQSNTEDTWAGWDEQRLVGFIEKNAGVRLEPAADKNIKESAEQRETKTAPRAQPPVSGALHVREVAVIPATGGHRRVLPQGQPFEIDLTLDMADIHAASTDAMPFHATAIAKDLSSGARMLLAGSQGACTPGETASIHLNSQGLPCGTYRLGIDLTMSDAASPASQTDLAAVIEGGVLKVY